MCGSASAVSVAGVVLVVWLVSLTTKKISQHPSCAHASPEATACAASSWASSELLSLSVVPTETVALIGTKRACEVRLESWGWWSCSGATVIISGVPSLSAEEQLVDAVA